MSNISAIENCYGCGGCLTSCPFEAFEFCIDSRGLYYPRVNSKLCMNCSKCKNLCYKVENFSNPQKCFLLEEKNEKRLLSASSGGAFFQLVKNFYVPNNTVIYGAAYNRNLEVEHSAALTLEEAKRFCKSKYVSSKTTSCFQEVYDYLKTGKRVLFSGTPCQIYGLKKYLKHDYDNLLTVDLICTGVMAPSILSKFLESYENENITYFDWRYKHVTENNNVWNIMDSTIFIDGKRQYDKKSILLKRLYGKKIGYKESCYSCKFASIERYSDITLGDFWSEKSYFGDYPNKGISAILVNTSKGIELVKRISKEEVNMSEISLNTLIKQNPALSHPTNRPKKNDEFWRDFNKLDIENLLKKYTKNSFKSILKMSVAKVLPQRIVDLIQQYKLDV